VPNERDDASTTRLQVTLPADQPIGSVQTRPMAGWKVTTQTRHLNKPIDFFGEKLDTVVSKITWTSTDGGLKPGTYDDFNVSLGPLPESGTLTFNAVQTYSSGEVVKWNEVAAEPSVEPEHPAPTLQLTAPAAEGAAATDAATDAADDTGATVGVPTQTSETATPGESGSSSSTWGIVLGGTALVVSLVTAALSWRRRRPVPASVEAERPLDRAGV
jgi:periplasmic copper chaperone A